MLCVSNYIIDFFVTFVIVFKSSNRKHWSWNVILSECFLAFKQLSLTYTQHYVSSLYLQWNERGF
jgi:hypothetical protein